MTGRSAVAKNWKTIYFKGRPIGNFLQYSVGVDVKKKFRFVTSSLPSVHECSIPLQALPLAGPDSVRATSVVRSRPISPMVTSSAAIDPNVSNSTVCHQ